MTDQSKSLIELAKVTFFERLREGRHYIKREAKDMDESTCKDVFDSLADKRFRDNRAADIVDLFRAEKNQSLRMIEITWPLLHDYDFQNDKLRQIHRAGYMLTMMKADNNTSGVANWNTLLAKCFDDYNPTFDTDIKQSMNNLKRLGEFDALLYLRKKPLLEKLEENRQDYKFFRLLPLNKKIFDRVQTIEP